MKAQKRFMSTGAPPLAADARLETYGSLPVFQNAVAGRQADLKHVVSSIAFSPKDVEEQLHSEEEAQLWYRGISGTAAWKDPR